MLIGAVSGWIDVSGAGCHLVAKARQRALALSSLGDEMTTRADTSIQPEAAPISTARSYKASDLVFMLAIGMLVGAAALYGIILWKTASSMASVMGLFRKAGG